MLPLLLVGAVGHDRRAQHALAVDHGARRIAERELALEHIALIVGEAGAAMRLRPAGAGPALGAQDLVPALLVVARQVHALLRDLAADVLRQVGADESPHLLAEGPHLRWFRSDF